MAKKRSTPVAPPSAIVLRVRVVRPPAGIRFCIQGESGEFLQQVRSDGSDLVFEISARVAEAAKGKPPRLLGRSVQGPPTARFLYIGSGALAGDAATPWQRRAKVPLTGITSELVLRALEKGALEATIEGKARDGGPACGTVPLVRNWTAVA